MGKSGNGTPAAATESQMRGQRMIGVIFLLALGMFVSMLQYESTIMQLFATDMLASKVGIATMDKSKKKKMQEKWETIRTFKLPSEQPDVTVVERLKRTTRNETEYQRFFSRCKPTTQVEIIEERLLANDGDGEGATKSTLYGSNSSTLSTKTRTRWTIQSMDENGNLKQIGGDEYFPIFYDNKQLAKNPMYGRDIVTAVGKVTDNNDGTYALTFVAAPYEADMSPLLGSGTFELWFGYTCGIGRMTRPSKDHWLDGGFLFTKHSRHNVTSPSIEPFRAPEVTIDFSKYNSAICFGDSVMQNVCGKAWATYYFKFDNMIVNENLGSEIRRDQWRGEAMQKLDEWHGAVLNGTEASVGHRDKRNIISTSRTGRQGVVLLLGSAAWEGYSNLGPLEDENFSDSIQMYKDMIGHIRAKYPNVTIAWRSPTAPHLHVVNEELCRKKQECMDRIRYESVATMQYLFEAQKTVMRQLDVPFLDMWNPSYLSPTWHMEGDSTHFHKWQNQYFMEIFHGLPLPHR